MTSLLTTLQQWLLFTGAALVTGCVAWRIQVMPGALRSLPPEGAAAVRSLEPRVASLGLASVGLVFLAWGLRLVVQVMGFRDPFVPLWDDVSFLLFEVFWGTVWMAQGGLVLVLGGALWMVGRSSRVDRRGSGTTASPGVGWSLAALMVAALAGTLAMSGHAMGVESWRVMVVLADATHALTAGVWIGTLAVILIVSRGGPGRGPAEFAAQIRSFSPMALGSGIVLVSMGTLLSWTHLRAVSDLWSMGYGRLLSAKVLVALVIFGLGFLNWKRGLPECHTPDGAADVRRRGSREVGLAVVVLLLTAFLVHATKP